MKTDNGLDPISATLRSEEERARRRIVFLTLIPIVVAAVLILITSLQVNDALDKRKEAQDSLSAITDQLKIVKDTLRSVETDLLAATELRAKLHAENEALQKIANLPPQRLRALMADVEKQTSELLADSAKAARITPRVYLHITHREQQDKAEDVEQYLKAEGFIVPGIDLVRSGPPSSELRFFRSGEQTVAETIQRICRNNGYDMKLQDLSRRYENSTAIRPGHYEIWFGDDF